MPGDADPPASTYEQAHRCLEIVLAALGEAGAAPEDVVRTRLFVTEPDHMAEALRAQREVLAEARPACTGIVTQLADPRWLVEIEVEAVIQ
jgi:enamine deaminase RidA (YjgF/YER057c/UK114 family)